MQFVRTEDLKRGMRLARPIYSKKGVLLYERDSKLTQQGIDSIVNFGLIGIYVLEPAEPVPPMTQADLDFERFQTMCVFSIKEELDQIIKTKKTAKLQNIVENILKNYGYLDKKVNFTQNLRSKEDYVQKHSLNVAMLCAMMSRVLNLKIEERRDTVTAALVHDIGVLLMDKDTKDKTMDDAMEKYYKKDAMAAGLKLIEDVFIASPGIKRTCLQCTRILESFAAGEDCSSARLVDTAMILTVAETFDTMTAMQLEKEPASEVTALKHLMAHPDVFDPRAVDALVRSINILIPGISVELNTGDKAMVLSSNEKNFLRPMLLSYKDNSIIDLDNEAVYGDMEIVDIMKTMDNRYIMDTDALRRQGFDVEEPEYVKVPEGR